MAHHPAAASSSSAPRDAAPPRKRGSYNCGRCGLPKKGHVCPYAAADPPAAPPAPPRSDHRLRRALSFDDDEPAELGFSRPPEAAGGEGRAGDDGDDDEEEMGVLPFSCMVEVLRRLSPKEMMGAAAVCRGWRECVKRVWRSVEAIRLRVSPRSQIGFVGSVLHKCAGLVRLSLTMESDADATVLACVAFSCPNLESFDISIADTAVNRVTGDELSRFVAEKRRLSILKIEGCTSLGCLNLCSSSLSTLWLSDLYCVSKAVFSCPNLKELSLDFTRQENDSTDLVSLMDSLGRTCPQLQNIHIASIQLCNDAVLALAGANLRDLRMLSLILGSRITDASVAGIVSSYVSLELLDLSGSSISDSGIGMICNAFPETLSRLLLALCPNITSSGIQFAAAQLPLLQLIDCGMSIQDLDSQNGSEYDSIDNKDGSGEVKKHQKPLNVKAQLMYQKLIVKHGRLKKLSLWGCSGLDALYLNCPELNDLNLNSCTNLHPERLLLQCPNLKNIHASSCQDMLVGAIRNQVLNEFAAIEHHFPCKRLADGSKRVQVPSFVERSSHDEKKKRPRTCQCTVHID